MPGREAVRLELGRLPVLAENAVELPPDRDVENHLAEAGLRIRD